MNGLIGKKIGMTSVFNEVGKLVPCTVVEAGPCVVTQVKTEKTDGYDAIQIGFGDKKEKNTTKPMRGHFDKAGVAPKAVLKELDVVIGEDESIKKGDVITVGIFEEGELVNITGTSKGKGFQGVVRRHGFSGVGMATHGQHNRLRAPGSIGMSSTPSRVLKGMRMAGRMGNDKVKETSKRIMKILPEENIILIKGSVPGAKGSYVLIEKY